jgi:thiamine biosynthesis lipoprotein
MRSRGPLILGACLAAASLRAVDLEPRLHLYQAHRLSMGCVYAIEAYGSDAAALPGFLDEALDEVDRIDRLMSHYKSDSALSFINREAARGPVSVEKELFEFIAEAMRYQRESGGAFDITVGPLMKAWGFFRGEGRLPGAEELVAARQRVGGAHVILNARDRTIAFDRPGIELDLGGIAKGYAVDRVADLLRRRQVAAALIDAGGSTIYGLGAPPGSEAWDVDVQDPFNSRKTAITVALKDRALSVAGRSEKSFAVGGVNYSHIMDPRTGHPAQGVLSVAVIADSGTAGDALDTLAFVMGPENSRAYLETVQGVEVFFFLPSTERQWAMVHIRSGS